MTLLQADAAGQTLAQLRRDLRAVQRDMAEQPLDSLAYRQWATQARNLAQQIEELEQHLREQA
ncbi:hypothetical protein GCM10027048_20140 [Hymenobacter coalescens]